MGKKSKDFKFVVGKPNDRSSRIWSVKVRKSDVYIMDDHGREHKISLHQSGVCHSALTKEACPQFGVKPERRTAVRWKLDLKDYESAVAFSLIFHYDQLGSHKFKASTTPVKEIPLPPVHSAAVVQFIKTRANGAEIQYDFHDGKHLLHAVELESGEVLSVIYSYTAAFNALVKECETRIRQITKDHPPTKPLIPSGGFVTVSDRNGLKYYVEINLGLAPA